MVAEAPSRFALCAEREDETLGEVVGWGMASAGDAVVVPVGSGLAGGQRGIHAAPAAPVHRD